MITGQRGFFSGQGSASRARRGCAFIVTLEDGHGLPTLDKGGRGQRSSRQPCSVFLTTAPTGSVGRIPHRKMLD